MGTLYRSHVNSMGFAASRLYDLEDWDMDDPRVEAMLANGWLTLEERPPSVDSTLRGQAMPPESGDPFEHETTHHQAPRLGVPELPPDLVRVMQDVADTGELPAGAAPRRRPTSDPELPA